ncbi:MAG: hypothetical protein KA714_11575 [Limnoraphis sp. WC205]|jgi:hypothetical protein|nr:hypothetical protein [Limnoraphis sp. WC205]
MKHKEIGFGLTINMGNYESVRFDLVAELEDWEDSEESMKALKKRLVEIARVEVNNGESTVIRKLDLDKKYIKEIKEKAREVEEQRRERNELIDQLQSLKFDISDASELLKAFKDLSYYNSVIADLRKVVDTYNNLMNKTKHEDTESVSLDNEF